MNGLLYNLSSSTISRSNYVFFVFTAPFEHKTLICNKHICFSAVRYNTGFVGDSHRAAESLYQNRYIANGIRVLGTPVLLLCAFTALIKSSGLLCHFVQGC